MNDTMKEGIFRMFHIKIKEDQHMVRYIKILREYDKTMSMQSIKTNIQQCKIVLAHDEHMSFDIMDDLYDIDRNKEFEKLIYKLIQHGAHIEIWLNHERVTIEEVKQRMRFLDETSKQVQKDIDREVGEIHEKSNVKC